MSLLMFVSRCGAGEGPGGFAFQGFLSFDIFFFTPPPFPILFSLFLSVRRGAGPEGESCGVGIAFVAARWGATGAGSFFPPGKGGRRSLEVPGFRTHTHLWLLAFPFAVGFGSLKDLGKFSSFGKSCDGFFPLHPRGFEAQQSAGMGLARWVWGLQGLFPIFGCRGGSHLLLQGHPGVLLCSQNDLAAVSASPATSGSGNLKFPVPSSLLCSSCSTDRGILQGGELRWHLPTEG